MPINHTIPIARRWHQISPDSGSMYGPKNSPTAADSFDTCNGGTDGNKTRRAPVRSLRLAGASEIRAISGKPPQRLTGWLLLRAGLGAMIPRSSTFTTHTRPTAGFFWGTTPFQLGTESILQALLMALLLFLLLFLIMWPLLVFLLLLLL